MATVTRQVGTVSAVDADKVQARVRLPECDNLRTHWLNELQRNTQNNKDYWLPDIGEQVEVLLDANGEDGVILGSVYSVWINRHSVTKMSGAPCMLMGLNSATTGTHTR